MRVLVTGGAGYVGSACLRFAIDAGHEAVAFDNLVQGRPDAVGDASLVRGDIADTPLLIQ